jgi:hypothetical protein
MIDLDPLFEQIAGPGAIGSIVGTHDIFFPPADAEKGNAGRPFSNRRPQNQIFRKFRALLAARHSGLIKHQRYAEGVEHFFVIAVPLEGGVQNPALLGICALFLGFLPRNADPSSSSSTRMEEAPAWRAAIPRRSASAKRATRAGESGLR